MTGQQEDAAGEWQQYTIRMKKDPNWPDHGSELIFNDCRYVRADLAAPLALHLTTAAAALYPFASALHHADKVVNADARHRISHLLKTAQFWLCYNDFKRAEAALELLRGKVEA